MRLTGTDRRVLKHHGSRSPRTTSDMTLSPALTWYHFRTVPLSPTPTSSQKTNLLSTRLRCLRLLLLLSSCPLCLFSAHHIVAFLMGRKRRAHPDSEDEAASDDDFDPRELQAVQNIRNKAKRTTRPPQQTTDDESDNDSGQHNGHGEEEDDDEDGEDGGADGMNGAGEGEEVDGDDDAGAGEDGIEEVSRAELLRLKRAKNRKKEKTEYVYNRGGLLAKLSELQLPADWPWIESLVLTPSAPLSIPDPHDDLAREAQFYSATQSAVLDGLQRLAAANIPYMRPADFYAEMVKPDTHMARVKDTLIREKSRMTAVTQRKQQQEARKYSKQVQVNKEKEKAQHKKQNLAVVSKQRQQAKQATTVLSEHSNLPGVNELARDVRAAQSVRRESRAVKKAEKYGYGGKKRRVKSNDEESASDVSGFKVGRNRAGFAGMRGGGLGSRRGRGGGRGGRGGRGGGRGGSQGGNRPGKARRQASTRGN